MKTVKEIRKFAMVHASALMLAATAATALAADKPLDVGKGEYDAACAAFSWSRACNERSPGARWSRSAINP